MHDLALIVSVFIATLVEAVEALTIVMAAGLARDWKSARQGTILGLLTVLLIILAFGPLLSQFPVSVLRLVVGLLSLIFGLQWLRKAILRSSGFKEMHDEDKIFEKELNQAKKAKTLRKSFVSDWYAFTISYKAVVIEGVEVAFLVVTFGALQGKILVAGISASVACLLVIVAGFALHRPLSKVPENAMKFSVGLILTTFGIFWATEGTGFDWSMQDAVLIPIFVILSSVSYGLVLILRQRNRKYLEAGLEVKPKLARQLKLPLAIEFIYDFVIGDDWPTAVLIYFAVTLGLMKIGFEYSLALVVLGTLALRMLTMTVSRSKVSV